MVLSAKGFMQNPSVNEVQSNGKLWDTLESIIVKRGHKRVKIRDTALQSKITAKKSRTKYCRKKAEAKGKRDSVAGKKPRCLKKRKDFMK